MPNKYTSSDWDKLTSKIKGEVVSHIRMRMFETDPDSSSKITRSLILETMIYLDGFNSCLKEYVEQPTSPEEVNKFLLEEAFRYVLRRIN